jgi:hypothetical protein
MIHADIQRTIQRMIHAGNPCGQSMRAIHADNPCGQSTWMAESGRKARPIRAYARRDPCGLIANGLVQLQPGREIEFFSRHKKALDTIRVAYADLDMAFRE